MYYYNDIFYNKIIDIIEDWDFDAIEENETLIVENCSLEPVHKITPELISELLSDYDEERYSEYNFEQEHKKVSKAISDNIDFEKINAQMPTLWYPNNTFTTFSMKQLRSFLH